MTEIAKEYATALFALAIEQGEEKAYLDALDLMAAALKDDADCLEFLASPGIPLSERHAVLEAAFGENLPEYTVSFIKLLCEKGRIRSFFDSVEEYRRLFQVRESLATAKVTSAVPLTEKEKEALKLKLENISKNTVELICTVDPTILGGVIVEIGGRIMDGSLAARLAEVKDVIT